MWFLLIFYLRVNSFRASCISFTALKKKPTSSSAINEPFSSICFNLTPQATIASLCFVIKSSNLSIFFIKFLITKKEITTTAVSIMLNINSSNNCFCLYN
jgi:hypothetical protein